MRKKKKEIIWVRGVLIFTVMICVVALFTILQGAIYKSGFRAGNENGYDEAISICLHEPQAFPYFAPTETREINFYKKCGLIKDNNK